MRKIILILFAFIIMQSLAYSWVLVESREVTFPGINTYINQQPACYSIEQTCYIIVSVWQTDGSEDLPDITSFESSYFIPDAGVGHIGLSSTATTSVEINGEQGYIVNFILQPNAIPITSIQDIYNYYENLGIVFDD